MQKEKSVIRLRGCVDLFGVFVVGIYVINKTPFLFVTVHIKIISWLLVWG